MLSKWQIVRPVVFDLGLHCAGLSVQIFRINVEKYAMFYVFEYSLIRTCLLINHVMRIKSVSTVQDNTLFSTKMW